MCTPSSDATRTDAQSSGNIARRHLHGMLRVAIVLAVIIALDIALCYVMEPYGAAAEVTWYDYRRSTEENIDTVIVGTSYAQRGLDPFALDETLGSSSFSLSTPAQALFNAVESARVAIEDHHVKRVILGVGANSFTELPWYNAEITFLQGIAADQPLPTVLHNLGNLVLDEDNFGTARSVLWVFPWNFSNVGHNPANIVRNVRCRLECADPIEASSVTNPDWHYQGRGHGSYDNVYDQTGLSTPEVVLDTDAPLLDSALAHLDELCQLCAQNDVALYVVNMPRPTYVTLAHQGEEGQRFWQTMAELEDFVEERGATYLDFNLAKPELYRPASDEFSDESHLNAAGSERFCHVLGEVIAVLEKQGDKPSTIRDSFFSYDHWAEALASYNPIEICYADTTLIGGTLTIEAHTIAQPEAQVEYQFVVDGSVMQEFSTDAVCTCRPGGEGDVIIEVHARVGTFEWTCHRVAVR